MSRRRSVAFIPVAVVALLGGLTVFSVSAAPPSGTDGSEVSRWNQVAATTLVAFPGPNGGAPPAFQINMGMVQGAVYDAVNAIGKKQHQPYLLKKRTGAKASIDAAVATAAYDVLSNLVSTAPAVAPFPGRAGLQATLDAEYAASLDAINNGSRKRQGIAIGHDAAKAMLRARVGDGRFGPSQWVPNAAAGHWQPLLNAMGQPILDPTPWAGGVEPFFIESSSQFRSVPPPALDSAQWAAEYNEVKLLGRATGSTRTDHQTYVAQVVAERTRPELERSRPAAHRRGTTSTPPTARDSSRCRTWVRRTRRSTAGTTSTTSISGDRGTRSRAGRTMETPPPIPTRPGRRSSQRRIPSGPRGTTASTPHTSPCCGSSSAMCRAASRSRAPS